ncbi:C40 family peptidase [Achromobacter sp. F4_2707]|uniref:C40 family peptidase n=1 Tax=Achromobacter sp. F4_2707 TaxID=3114286 RepID=UPI0039C665C0
MTAILLSGCAGTPPKSSSTSYAVPPQHRQEVVMLALGLTGSPYRYGGTDPIGGFDCSGLVNYVFNQAAGTAVPRTTGDQANASRRISRSALREGDLVFFNTLGRANSHVGIYIGNGRFVNAPSSGGYVRIDTLDNPYFSKRFTSARTLFANR